MDFRLTEDDQLIQETIRDMAQEKFKSRATLIDQESQFPEKNITELAEMGLLGSILDPEFGGAGASTMAYSLIFIPL